VHSDLAKDSGLLTLRQCFFRRFEETYWRLLQGLRVPGRRFIKFRSNALFPCFDY
jgi:hypothetical protein